MEMMILSILGPQLHCEWRLPSYQVALLTSVKHLLGCFLDLVDCVFCAFVCRLSLNVLFAISWSLLGWGLVHLSGEMYLINMAEK